MGLCCVLALCHSFKKCALPLSLPLHYLFASLVAQTVKNLLAIQATWVQSLGKIPWRRKWQPTPVFLPGEFHEQRSMVDYSPWGGRVGQDWVTTLKVIRDLKSKYRWLTQSVIRGIPGLPGGPVAKILHVHCRGKDSVPGQKLKDIPGRLCSFLTEKPNPGVNLPYSQHTK